MKTQYNMIILLVVLITALFVFIGCDTASGSVTAWDDVLTFDSSTLPAADLTNDPSTPAPESSTESTEDISDDHHIDSDDEHHIHSDDEHHHDD